MREDWATQATDAIDRVVGLVRDKTVVPARSASKALVYGMLAAALGSIAMILVVIGLFRGAVIVIGNAWGAYLATGGILVVAGMFCWSRRSPRSNEPTT